MTLSSTDVFGHQLQELVTELEAMYPPVNPTPSDEDRRIMYMAGQRSVVEYIIAKLQD